MTKATKTIEDFKNLVRNPTNPPIKLPFYFVYDKNSIKYGKITTNATIYQKYPGVSVYRNIDNDKISDVLPSNSNIISYILHCEINNNIVEYLRTELPGNDHSTTEVHQNVNGKNYSDRLNHKVENKVETFTDPKFAKPIFENTNGTITLEIVHKDKNGKRYVGPINATAFKLNKSTEMNNLTKYTSNDVMREYSTVFSSNKTQQPVWSFNIDASFPKEKIVLLSNLPSGVSYKEKSGIVKF